MKTDIKIIGLSILSSIAASLCCITPILALIAGSSGFASSFSWLEPFRPFLIGITVLMFGYAWYRKLKPTSNNDCNCETERNPRFIKSKTFLSVATIFAAFMLAFPFYSNIFYSDKLNESTILEQANVQKILFTINGMTCKSCEIHIDNRTREINGVISTKTSYRKGNTIVVYDRTKTDDNHIEQIIKTTGYSVIKKRKFNGTEI